LRRFQGTFFPSGLILAVTFAGSLGYAFPESPTLLMIASFAPAWFALVLFLGTVISLQVKRQERLSARRKRMTEFSPLFVRLQQNYGLTYQEARICEELHAGRTSLEIRERLNIHPSTFKVHKKRIYAKTIEKSMRAPSNARDKWQKLDRWLKNLAG
jgi:DNA-binding CsgD family transcriptional regulator